MQLGRIYLHRILREQAFDNRLTNWRSPSLVVAFCSYMVVGDILSVILNFIKFSLSIDSMIWKHGESNLLSYKECHQYSLKIELCSLYESCERSSKYDFIVMPMSTLMVLGELFLK